MGRPINYQKVCGYLQCLKWVSAILACCRDKKNQNVKLIQNHWSLVISLVWWLFEFILFPCFIRRPPDLISSYEGHTRERWWIEQRSIFNFNLIQLEPKSILSLSFSALEITYKNPAPHKFLKACKYSQSSGVFIIIGSFSNDQEFAQCSDFLCIIESFPYNWECSWWLEVCTLSIAIILTMSYSHSSLQCLCRWRQARFYTWADGQAMGDLIWFITEANETIIRTLRVLSSKIIPIEMSVESLDVIDIPRPDSIPLLISPRSLGRQDSK